MEPAENTGTAGARTSLSLDVLTSRARLSSLEPRWNALVEDSPRPNPFLTWEWITTWLEVFADDGTLRVVVAREPESGDPVGIAPFVVQGQPRDRPALWRELVFAGSTVTAPDHLDIIARPGRQEEVSRAVAGWIASEPRRRVGDLLRVDGLSPDAALGRALDGLDGSGARSAWEITCPYVPLPDSWEEFESALDGKFRRDLNRRIRKLTDEADDPITMVTVTGRDRVDAGLSDLFRLHQALHGSNGSGGAFDTARKRRFYRELARRFADRGWLRLHLVRVGERAIAAALCFRYGDRAWFYQTGFDRDWYRYSPGHVVIRHAIRSAMREGASEFDMLRGDHRYKYDWNAESRAILKTRRASTAVGRVIVPVTGWLREGKERWKEWRGTH